MYMRIYISNYFKKKKLIIVYPYAYECKFLFTFQSLFFLLCKSITDM